MMYTLQKLNVVRIVDSESKMAKLLKIGFNEVVEPVAKSKMSDDPNVKAVKKKIK